MGGKTPGENEALVQSAKRLPPGSHQGKIYMIDHNKDRHVVLNHFIALIQLT